jgi:hypothetical protein
MKFIIVVLILIQISLIATNPNNRIEKESKETGRNLSPQRRLGIFDFIIKVGEKMSDTIYNLKEKVITIIGFDKTVEKFTLNAAGGKVKDTDDKVIDKVKSFTKVGKKTVVNFITRKAKTTLNDASEKIKKTISIFDSLIARLRNPDDKRQTQGTV